MPNLRSLDSRHEHFCGAITRPGKNAGLTQQIAALAEAVKDLADAINRRSAAQENRPPDLGVDPPSRYIGRPDPEVGLVDEPAMAQQLGISIRTLARYRRDGRLPGCWLRNGKHIRWRVPETLAAWQRGMA